MKNISPVDSQEEWLGLLAKLPQTIDLETTARETKAFERSRGIKSPKELLRLILAYCTCGISLRTTAAWAQWTNLADISDVAVLKRIRKALPWLRLLVAKLLNLPESPSAQPGRVRPVYLVDGTYIKGRKAGNDDWRNHTCFDAGQRSFRSLALTDAHGAEDLRRFQYAPGSIVIADRGYAKAKQIHYVVSQGSDYLVRVGLQSLALRNADGTQLRLLDQLAAVTDDIPISLKVHVASSNHPNPEFLLPARLVILKKDPANAARSEKQVRRKAQKNQTQINPASLLMAGYFVVLTSLPEEVYSTETVLLLYRVRWQIEMAFKRLKSLVRLDEFKAKDPVLIQACLYAGLLLALLIDGLADAFQAAVPELQRQKRNVSLWRTQVIFLLQVRASVLGATGLETPLKMTEKIWRNICEPPRKRQLQSILSVPQISLS